MDASPGIGVILLMLVLMVVGIVIGLLISAAILRGAVSLCNKMMGNDSYGQVAVPSLGRAMLLSLVIFVLQGVVSVGVAIVLGLMSASAASLGANSLAVIPQLASVPVGFFVNSALLSALLPTSFTKGMVVALCQYLICILIGIVVGVLCVALFGAMLFSLLHR